MSQKYYNFGIVEQLIKKDTHLRELARIIKTNQTTTARKLKELYDKNIVDFRQEGKNKVFFLKDSLEAKQQVYMLEINKLAEIVERYPRLRRIIKAIKGNQKIRLALLFGSYAKGIAKKDSDIDIYIETTNKKIKDEVEMIDSKLSVKIGVYDSQNLLIKEIKKNHAIIKGVEDYYEKEPIFN